MGVLVKLGAFIKRDFQSEVSYRLAFVLQVGGMFLSLLAFFYLTGMIDPDTAGLDGIRPFDWMLVGLSFQFYFSAALFAFSQKIRDEQVLGTLEAMLVSPTPKVTMMGPAEKSTPVVAVLPVSTTSTEVAIDVTTERVTVTTFVVFVTLPSRVENVAAEKS